MLPPVLERNSKIGIAESNQRRKLKDELNEKGGKGWRVFVLTPNGPYLGINVRGQFLRIIVVHGNHSTDGTR